MSEFLWPIESKKKPPPSVIKRELYGPLILLNWPYLCVLIEVASKSAGLVAESGTTNPFMINSFCKFVITGSSYKESD